MAILVGVVCTRAYAAADPRVTKTILATKINLGPDAVSTAAVPGVGERQNICLSSDGTHLALLLHTSQKPDHFAVSIDGKTGREYDRVSELQWDPRGRFLFIGQRDGKSYVVSGGEENTADAADGIVGLCPRPPGNMAGENLAAMLYGARQNGLWSLHGAGNLDRGQKWANWLGTWPNGSLAKPSLLYEVTDSKGATALVRDSNMLGPRSQFAGDRKFVPVWNADGSHVVTCLENERTDYLCLDKDVIVAATTYPTIAWSGDNRRFALFGHGMKTCLFSVGADGKANADLVAEWESRQDKANPGQTGVVWSANGIHYAALNTAKSPVLVWRDGMESGTLEPVAAEKGEDKEARRIAGELNDEAILTPLLTWNPLGTHLAVAGNGEIDNGLYLDQKQVAKAGGFASLTWTADGERPVAIARDDEFADIVPISTWVLKSDADTIEFTYTAEENTAIPLCNVLSPAKGIYRIVMLERQGKAVTEDENAQFASIVRYDIKLGR